MATVATMEPANRIITALGGTGVVSRITGAHRTRVWKWTQPKHKGGTDGIIPIEHIRALIEHGETINVSLSADDFLPVKTKTPEGT
jgi:hypothetical protein